MPEHDHFRVADDLGIRGDKRVSGPIREALISDSHQSETVCRRLGFVTIRHYNVFMPIGHDSLLYSRVETVLASEIAEAT
jgi:hypothetical protein